MNISKVTLEEMLIAREARVQKQRQLIEKNGLPLVCFTMNIAGPVKNTPLVQFVFMWGANMLYGLFGDNIKERDIQIEKTGCTAYYVIDCEASEIKQKAVSIENSSEAARLYDIDVIDTDGKKLSRSEKRKCIICSEKAAVCARSRAHGLEQVQSKTDELLIKFAAEKLRECACEALITEVEAVPKPGLVDARGSGSHKDMDICTFKRSIAALAPYFEEFAVCGMRAHEKTPDDIMQLLRQIGIRAEKAMYEATDNVNTHKGMIFSLGLILCDLGRRLMGEHTALCSLAMSGMDESFSRAMQTPVTHGEVQYKKKGAMGIRGEAANGFPHAREAALRFAQYRKNFSVNDAAVLTLADIMRTLEDTNILHRGGTQALMFMHKQAEIITAMPEAERLTAMEKLDAEFIERNISPGGCADTLALAIFLDLLEKKYYYSF
ncbi:MAG: citrate lyase holo-[Clostridia bacterium]|nr:citrate lyase holo-[acyl-carrier protein] synthase [Clostridia bacterium]